MFKKIKFWDDSGLWTAEQVAQAAEKGLITKDEHKAIVGEE